MSDSMFPGAQGVQEGTGSAFFSHCKLPFTLHMHLFIRASHLLHSKVPVLSKNFLSCHTISTYTFEGKTSLRFKHRNRTARKCSGAYFLPAPKLLWFFLEALQVGDTSFRVVNYRKHSPSSIGNTVAAWTKAVSIASDNSSGSFTAGVYEYIQNGENKWKSAEY